MRICPKCGHEREPSDDNYCPDWQCPRCGAAYGKVARINMPPKEHAPTKPFPWKTFSSFLLLALLLIAGIYYWRNHQATLLLASAPAATINTSATIYKDPLQVMLNGKVANIEKNGYSLTPLASFELVAKVLSTENYWMGRMADLSPTDLALGWGSMATEEMMKKVAITQSDRWFYWFVAQNFSPELGREISTHASNMHIIPATPAVEKALSAVQKGQIVYIKGFLVEANGSDGWKWRSSLSREDTGDGSCELFLANELQIR